LVKFVLLTKFISKKNFKKNFFVQSVQNNQGSEFEILKIRTIFGINPEPVLKTSPKRKYS